MVLRHGNPDVLINGSQFSAQVFTTDAKDWEIELQYTAPYSPIPSKGGRVLKTLIIQYAKDDHRFWNECLQEIMFAVNTIVHDCTKHTPTPLCFRRELHLPRPLTGPLFKLGVKDNKSHLREDTTYEWSSLRNNTKKQNAIICYLHSP